MMDHDVIETGIDVLLYCLGMFLRIGPHGTISLMSSFETCWIASSKYGGEGSFQRRLFGNPPCPHCSWSVSAASSLSSAQQTVTSP